MCYHTVSDDLPFFFFFSQLVLWNKYTLLGKEQSNMSLRGGGEERREEGKEACSERRAGGEG